MSKYNRPVGVSPANWKQLDDMRRKIPGKKEFESLNDVITRLLAERKKDAAAPDPGPGD